MMRSGVALCLATVFSSLLLGPMPMNAQEGATFEAKPLGGQDTFQVGQRIPLELSFSSLAKDRFEINMASYDRSGRMSYEQFEVDPKAGWADPLALYFSTSGGIGGGLTSFRLLSSTATVMSIDLNEWVRFDQPGTYRVAVSSRRVTDRAKKRVFNGDPPEPLRSKPFVLHIVPATSAWQAATLQTSLAQLEAAPSAQGQPFAERKAALADLRFLGSRGAIRALAANLRDDRPELAYQSAFGLMGVAEPMRDAAVEALEQRIGDPMFPISGWLIETLSVLDARGHPAANGVDEGRSSAKEAAWRKVFAGLSRKEGKARAATVQTLLSTWPAGLDAESRTELAGALSGSFVDLTEEQRTVALLGEWDSLRSEAMLPALQASAKLTLSHPGSNEVSVYSRRKLKAAALARWYELDPDGAMREIWSQIGSATPSLTAENLAFLPKQSFPQFEPLWAQRMVESSDYEEEAVLGGLLVRFGTGAASGQVASKLKTRAGTWACEPQAAALAYLVKFEPEQALPLLQGAVSGAGKTRCHSTLFHDVSAHASGAVLTDVALAALDNADRRVASDALVYLVEHGRKEDEQAIWNRYVKWSEQWSGKADVLDSNDRSSLERIYPEIALGENLAHALIANQGWLAGHDLIAQVLRLCVGQQMCQQVQRVADLASSPYRASVYGDGVSETYQVAQYSMHSIELLDRKIAQYPKGTAFRLMPGMARNREQRAMQSEMRGIFKRYGMSLEEAPD